MIATSSYNILLILYYNILGGVEVGMRLVKGVFNSEVKSLEEINNDLRNCLKVITEASNKANAISKSTPTTPRNEAKPATKPPVSPRTKPPVSPRTKPATEKQSEDTAVARTDDDANRSKLEQEMKETEERTKKVDEERIKKEKEDKKAKDLEIFKQKEQELKKLVDEKKSKEEQEKLTASMATTKIDSKLPAATSAASTPPVPPVTHQNGEQNGDTSISQNLPPPHPKSEVSNAARMNAITDSMSAADREKLKVRADVAAKEAEKRLIDDAIARGSRITSRSISGEGVPPQSLHSGRISSIRLSQMNNNAVRGRMDSMTGRPENIGRSESLGSKTESTLNRISTSPTKKRLSITGVFTSSAAGVMAGQVDMR